jgi:hypothetical protein
MATTPVKDKVASAWEEFFEAEKVFSKKELNEQGWLTCYDIQEKMKDVPIKTIMNKMFSSSAHDRKTYKIEYRGGARSFTFFRPKV